MKLALIVGALVALVAWRKADPAGAAKALPGVFENEAGGGFRGLVGPPHVPSTAPGTYGYCVANGGAFARGDNLCRGYVNPDRGASIRFVF